MHLCRHLAHRGERNRLRVIDDQVREGLLPTQKLLEAGNDLLYGLLRSVGLVFGRGAKSLLDRRCGKPIPQNLWPSTSFQLVGRVPMAILTAKIGAGIDPIMRAITIAAVVFVGLAGVLSSAAQAQSGLPDWSGQWVRAAGMSLGWDPSKPGGLAQEAPLTPASLAKFKAAMADRAAGGVGGDLTALCLPHGMPRMMIGVYPIEFVVTPAVTYVLTDYTTHRRIYTDGRDWPSEPLPSYNGYSIGRWVDAGGSGHYDTLEVETRSFKGPRTFESSGMPLDDDNATIVRERIGLDKSDRSLMHIQITVLDHALARPWTVDRAYRRETNPVWDFVDCAENNPHVLVGKESYMISSDGFLMPTKRGQAAPDLRYFNRTPKGPAN